MSYLLQQINAMNETKRSVVKFMQRAGGWRKPEENSIPYPSRALFPK